jgi:hypothetical protein
MGMQATHELASDETLPPCNACVDTLDYIKIVNKSQSSLQFAFKNASLYYSSPGGYETGHSYPGSISDSVVLASGEYRLFKKPLKIFIVTENSLFLLWNAKMETRLRVEDVLFRRLLDFLPLVVELEKETGETRLTGMRVTFSDK